MAGHEHHVDYDLSYADGGLARYKHVPVTTGADGKKHAATAAEVDAARKPIGAIGYAAERTDIKSGTIVELHLVKLRGTPAAKTTADDLLVKYAMILGEDPTPPKADGKTPDAGAKKKK